MATPQAALKKMREICLSLPDSREGEHFGQSAFRAGGRMFASCGFKDGTCRIVVQLEAARVKRLLSSDPRFRRYPLAPNCVELAAEDVRSWSEVRDLVRESYRLNVPAKARPRRPARAKTGR